jgi:hypothetical protein
VQVSVRGYRLPPTYRSTLVIRSVCACMRVCVRVYRVCVRACVCQWREAEGRAQVDSISPGAWEMAGTVRAPP